MRLTSSSILSALVGLSLLVGTAAAPVLAQTGTTGAQAPTEQTHHARKFDALNLTDAQKAQIKQIHEQEKAEVNKVFTPEQLNQLQTAKAQGTRGRGVWKSLNLTDAQKTQIREIKQKYRPQIKAVFTPAQQQQLEQMRQSHKKGA